MMDKGKPKKIALITGSSRGIGAVTAKLFTLNGYAVCINYKSNEKAARSIVEEITGQGGQCISIQADVSREDDVLKLFKAVDDEYGALTCLVNNAGVLRKQCRLEELSADRINEILINNVTSYFICSREATRRMSTKNGGTGGTIINVSSVASRSGSPNEYIDYAASKGAIDTLTRGLSKEVASEGIRVNCVRPGLIYTEMHQDGGEPGRVDRLKSVIPMQRGGQPAEVAEAVLWLASDKSSFVTGSFIDLAGGL